MENKAEALARVRLTLLLVGTPLDPDEIRLAIETLRARAAGSGGPDVQLSRAAIRAETFEGLLRAARRSGSGRTAASISRRSWPSTTRRVSIAARLGRRLILFLGLHALLRDIAWDVATRQMVAGAYETERIRGARSLPAPVGRADLARGRGGLPGGRAGDPRRRHRGPTGPARRLPRIGRRRCPGQLHGSADVSPAMASSQTVRTASSRSRPTPEPTRRPTAPASTRRTSSAWRAGSTISSGRRAASARRSRPGSGSPWRSPGRAGSSSSSGPRRLLRASPSGDRLDDAPPE